MGKVKNERVILFRTKNINKNTVRYEIEVESCGIFWNLFVALQSVSGEEKKSTYGAVQ